MELITGWRIPKEIKTLRNLKLSLLLIPEEMTKSCEQEETYSGFHVGGHYLFLKAGAGYSINSVEISTLGFFDYISL